ncbi:hypothetical protein JTB14_021835 [Gonioctena quinquepunctata]|nr:hypothetical protein JTB14_021835 [Gonioctena quinquepunctata]
MIMRKFSIERQPDKIKDRSDSFSVRFEGNEISREINIHTIPESCRSSIPEENTIGRNIPSGTRKSDKSIEIGTGRNFSSSTRISEGNSIDNFSGVNISSDTRKSDQSIDIATGRNVSSSFEEVPEVVLNINKKIDMKIVDPVFPKENIVERCWLENESTYETPKILSNKENLRRYDNGLVRNKHYYCRIGTNYIVGFFKYASWPELDFESIETLMVDNGF